MRNHDPAISQTSGVFIHLRDWEISDGKVDTRPRPFGSAPGPSTVQGLAIEVYKT